MIDNPTIGMKVRTINSDGFLRSGFVGLTGIIYGLDAYNRNNIQVKLLQEIEGHTIWYFSRRHLTRIEWTPEELQEYQQRQTQETDRKRREIHANKYL